MTEDQIEKLQAGEDIDKLIAEKVIGLDLKTLCDGESGDSYFAEYTGYWCKKCGPIDGRTVSPDTSAHYPAILTYSKSIGAAWEVVGKIKSDRRPVINYGTRDFAIHWNKDAHGYFADGLENERWTAGYFDDGYQNSFNMSASADTAPLAICRFALKLIFKNK